MRLIVLRHGSTRWNQERRYQGCVDTRLSAEGLAQAEAAAHFLVSRQLSAVYASSLSRAQETARVIADRHGLPVLTAPAFREICLGVWEGHTVPEVQTRFPELYAAWLERPHTVAFPAGESMVQVRERVLEGLAHLRAAHAGDTVCLVAHGVTIRLLILDALGLTPDRLWSLRVSPAAISELEYGETWATLHRMNVQAHLNGLPAVRGAPLRG